MTMFYDKLVSLIKNGELPSEAFTGIDPSQIPAIALTERDSLNIIIHLLNARNERIREHIFDKNITIVFRHENERDSEPCFFDPKQSECNCGMPVSTKYLVSQLVDNEYRDYGHYNIMEMCDQLLNYDEKFYKFFDLKDVSITAEELTSILVGYQQKNKYYMSYTRA